MTAPDPYKQATMAELLAKLGHEPGCNYIKPTPEGQAVPFEDFVKEIMADGPTDKCTCAHSALSQQLAEAQWILREFAGKAAFFDSRLDDSQRVDIGTSLGVLRKVDVLLLARESGKPQESRE